jgi:hypothetical protein
MRTFLNGSLLFALVVLLLPACPAWSQAIPVPNYSFESPTVADAPPYAGTEIDDWTKSPAPAWWTATPGNTSLSWAECSGEFVNVPFAPVAGADGNQPAQLAFMFAVPGYELYQTLGNTYQVGKSYQLTVGIQGGGYYMPAGTPMAIELYYPDASGDRISVGSLPVSNNNSAGSITQLTDYTLTIPAVAAGDAWAGQPIGIDLVQTISPDTYQGLVQAAGTSGYWDIANVRLNATPEPSSLALLAVGGIGMLAARRWRASKR